MSKLSELMVALCPDGVEYKTLEALGFFSNALTGKPNSCHGTNNTATRDANGRPAGF